MMQTLSAKSEWAANWPVAFVALIGVSSGTMFAYTSGVFMEDITNAFGWTRTQYSSVFVVQMALGLIVLPLVGKLIDKIGPRRVALLGMLPFVISFSSLGLANGEYNQWVLLFAALAVCQAMVAQTVWVAAVVTRFEVSRGMALAVALAGLGLGSFLWPLLAALFIEMAGWRAAFALLALTWAAIAAPLTVLFFHAKPSPQSSGHFTHASAGGVGHALRSRSFIGLAIAGGLFACSNYGLSVHLVPLMRLDGMSLTTAAGIAGLLGIFSVMGRLGTGFLLDRWPTRPIAVAAFLLPIPAVSLLLIFPGTSEAAIATIVLMGLASGAEIDIITFIVARRFKRHIFGSVYALFSAIIAASASIGPVIAGAVFDTYRTYNVYLFLMMPMAAIGAALIGWIPLEEREGEAAPEHPSYE